jgi:hypothetical protein
MKARSTALPVLIAGLLPREHAMRIRHLALPLVVLALLFPNPKRSPSVEAAEAVVEVVAAKEVACAPTRWRRWRQCPTRWRSWAAAGKRSSNQEVGRIRWRTPHLEAGQAVATQQCCRRHWCSAGESDLRSRPGAGRERAAWETAQGSGKPGAARRELRHRIVTTSALGRARRRAAGAASNRNNPQYSVPMGSRHHAARAALES